MYFETKNIFGPDDYKNAVITFLKIDQRTWEKYLRNKKILYNKMQKC